MFHAWIIWLLSALFIFYKYALEVSPSIMANELMRAFSLTGAQMGNLAATYYYAYMLMQIPAGLLIDRWGPRRVTTLAMVVCASGTFFFAQSDSFWMAFVSRFFTGAGAAFAVVNCFKLVANWFPARRFAFMAGLMMTLGMLGAVGGQGPLAAFIRALDWRSALEYIAGGGIFLALLFVLVVRDRAPHHEKVVLMPSRTPVLQNLKRILSSKQAWYLSFFSGFAFAPVSAFGGLWGVPFLVEKFHFSHADAAQGSSLIFLGFAAGAPLFGWLSDRIRKRRPPMFWGTLIAGFCLCTIVYVPSIPIPFVYSLLFLFGFSVSGFMLCFTMIKEINPVMLAATSTGFMNAFDALFGAFSDPLTGKVLDFFWTGKMADGARVFTLTGYQYALLILVVYFLLAFVFLKPVKETHCKETYPSSLP